ncbi:hypothetical protein [Natronococcus sp. A-GB7]|uniref:hypothetical protein n=1 Tax=Natronococcus sp. A-GB7 TaxID=3037649 RepID=UPI00241F1F21|nr:hypothetical protein [Natronococcus sp. A-GB7]MDG5817527.1 hypothetical protein [Natronococcus sp. A-GB7]
MIKTFWNYLLQSHTGVILAVLAGSFDTAETVQDDIDGTIAGVQGRPDTLQELPDVI